MHIFWQKSYNYESSFLRQTLINIQKFFEYKYLYFNLSFDVLRMDHFIAIFIFILR